MAVGQNRFGPHFGVSAPPIFEPILVGIGMFIGGTGFSPIATYPHGRKQKAVKGVAFGIVWVHSLIALHKGGSLPSRGVRFRSVQLKIEGF